MKHQTFAPGDRVAFARHWLRSVGAIAGALPFARGTVRATQAFGGPGNQLVAVEWGPFSGCEECSKKVLSCNLVRVDRIHLEPV